MRAVFLGTPSTAVPTLESLVTAGHEVPLVITQPDRPAGRSGTPRPPAVKQAAAALGLRVEQPHKVRDAAFLRVLDEARPDVLVVVAYGRILPRPVLELAPMGAVNVHFSLLPKYRGAAPVQWALVNREPVTGVTTMRMSEGLDEGDVLLQHVVAVEPGEHAPSLLERLARIGATLAVETLRRMATGVIEPRPQAEADATFAPRLTVEDGVADFRMTARELEGRVRGLDPWPGVWARRGDRRIRLVRATVHDGGVEEPEGTVVAFADDALLVACGWGSLLAVRALQPEGRSVVSAREAVNGRQLRPGDRLEGRAG